MLDFADFVAINKFDRKGAADALRDVRKQYQRNRELFKQPPGRDAGLRHDRGALQRRRRDRAVPGAAAAARRARAEARARARCPRSTTRHVDARSTRSCRPRGCATSPRSPTPCAAITSGSTRRRRIARERQQLRASRAMLGEMQSYGKDLTASDHVSDREAAQQLKETLVGTRHALDALIEDRDAASRSAARRSCSTCGRRRRRAYAGDEYVVKIRDKEIRTRAHHDVAVGHARSARSRCRSYEDDGEILRWQLRENVPGQLPVHRRRVRVQARERGPDAHVRRRGRRLPHQHAASTCSPTACRRSACPPRSTRSRSTATTRRCAPTSTARSATRACRSRRSTT